MTQPDWDDDRLEAAFHARFDRSAPSTLSKDIQFRIAGITPGRFGGLRFGRAWSVAASALVVALVAGSALLGLGGLGRAGGSPLPSDATASAAGPSATPTQQAIPGSVFGLPILHVSDAITIRDAGADDRELAVQGWFTPSLAPSLRCAAPRFPQTSPIQEQCGDDAMWLTRDAESLIHRTGNQTSHTEPQGPAIRPYLDNLELSWLPADLGVGANGDSTPTDVVFVGHFDDRRAALCPEVQRAACLDRFVVDAVALVRGVPQLRSEMHIGSGSSTVADIEAIIANETPESPILSMTVVDGKEGLPAIEPTLAIGQEGLVDPPLVWVVRVLESDRVVTYLVIDGSDGIYEMTQEGEAVHVGGTTGDPVVTPGPWPPDDAVVIALTSPVGAGEPSVQVAVVDQSGRLFSVTEKGTVDPSTPTFDGRFGAYAEPGMPGRVHLEWIGGICDSRITVMVADDLGAITFDMGPQPANCDSIGVGRELVLDFDGSVDVPAIALSDVTDAPVPVATSPAYQLDCGPLGPDTCEQKAASIVSANATGSPTKRLRSITFSDECGSYMALYDDGSGVTASIDCILP